MSGHLELFIETVQSFRMMFLPKYGLLMQMYDKYLQTKALSIVYSCISMLGVMSGVYKVPFGNLTSAIFIKTVCE